MVSKLKCPPFTAEQTARTILGDLRAEGRRDRRDLRAGSEQPADLARRHLTAAGDKRPTSGQVQHHRISKRHQIDLS